MLLRTELASRWSLRCWGSRYPLSASSLVEEAEPPRGARRNVFPPFVPNERVFQASHVIRQVGWRFRQLSYLAEELLRNQRSHFDRLEPSGGRLDHSQGKVILRLSPEL